MINFLHYNETKFWNDFIKNYKNLIYYNVRNSFNYYKYFYQNDDLDDCYQDILLKVYSKKEKIFINYKKDKSNFSTYLSVICNNHIIDYLNDKKYKYSHNNDEIIDNEYDISIDIDIENIFNKNILNTKEKMLIKLFYIKELKSNEIGEIMNISPSTVRVLKKQALDKLKRYYHE